MEQKKKPVTKRWWFWLVVLVLVFGIAGAVSDNDNDEPDTVNEETLYEQSEPPKETEATETVEAIDPIIEDDNSSEMQSEAPEEIVVETPEQDSTTPPQSSNADTTSDAPEQGSEPSPEPNQSTANDGNTSGSLVYVSNSGKVHSISDCSGMKNYTEMTLDDALSKNYEYCSNCW